jgi:predicted acylesterase/phospholipase RssA
MEIVPIILSGGGSRGPYGAGALQALRHSILTQHSETTFCYFGTSVGALNATMAAQGQLEELTTLYAKLKTKNVVGKDDPKLKGFGVWLSSDNKPYGYFSNKHLRRTIEGNASFSKLIEQKAHLVMCATNCLTGDLETFYVSNLIDDFIAVEEAGPTQKRRLNNYHRIKNQQDLVDALLACTAIPIYFPPVKIRSRHYIDGGIGNNTPARQAAFFSRYCGMLDKGKVQKAICVINDPKRFGTDSGNPDIDLTDTIGRTIGILQNEIVSDSLIAWNRINQEVGDRQRKVGQVQDILIESGKFSEPELAPIVARISDVLQTSTSLTQRSQFDLIIVQPEKQLPVSSLLNFDPRISVEIMKQGAIDCFKALCEHGLVTTADAALALTQISESTTPSPHGRK